MEPGAGLRFRLSNIEDKIISYIDQNKKNLVRTCSDLIRINSSNPPGDCSQVVSYLASEYREAGAKFSVLSAGRVHLSKFGHNYPRNNFVSAIGPKDEDNVGLAIGTHMDVVPAGKMEKWKYPPFSGTIANSKIWGRGACDAKCSLAAQLFAIKAILDSGVALQRSLICIGTVDDEAPKDATGPGMEFVVKEGLAKVGYNFPRFAINAEASGLSSIWGSFSGGLMIKMSVRGKAGHPPVGVNALHNAIKLWNSIISKRNRRLIPKSPRLVWLNGGSETDFGFTPDKAQMIFRVPIHSADISPQGALGEIRRIARDEKRKDPQIITEEIKVLAEARTFEMGKGNFLVRTLKSCARDVGVGAEYGGGTVGPGDLMFFLLKGIPGVTYGAGSLERCHVTNEYVTEDELVNQAKIYALSSLRLCGSVS